MWHITSFFPLSSFLLSSFSDVLSPSLKPFFHVLTTLATVARCKIKAERGFEFTCCVLHQNADLHAMYVGHKRQLLYLPAYIGVVKHL